jgi:MFS superfamily sulfate permease-like transporter
MVVNFVSETVLVGFKSGIAFVLAGTQIPKLLGFAGGHGSFWSRLDHIVRHIGDTHPASFALGATALVILLGGKRLLPGKPVALGVVVAGVAATSLLGLHDAGVKVLGDVPQGLPRLGLPAVSMADLDGVVPIAVACFLLAAVESAAIGRMFALKHGYRFDANRELLAIGGANVMAGLGRGFPVSGGMSQSLVNESSGARTPLSGLTAALIVVAIVLWFSGLLRDLPQPVLAAIVLAAVAGLINLTAIRRLWRFSGVEFSVAAFAFLGVLGEGILRGVAIGVLLSLFALLKRASAPNVVELGRVDGSNEFASITVDTPRTRIPGALIARIDGSLLYFNVEFTRDRLMEMLANHDGVTRVVLFLGAVPAVDLAGADLVIELHHALAARGIELRVAGAHTRVRTRLISAGADIAFAERYRSVPDALAAAA